MSLLVPALLAAASLAVQPPSARPGDVVLVTVAGATQPPSGRLGDEALHFVPHRAGYLALHALAVDELPGKRRAELSGEGPEAASARAELEILPARFRRRRLRVNKRYTQPSKAEQRRIDADQEAFDRAFARPLEPPLFDGPFQLPREAEITAPFGDLRLVNGKKKSQHFGLDLDGKTGEPVLAANDGVVVMVRDCFSTGNTVLVHHGAQTFTSYAHLSATQVSEGQRVRRGERLGSVGRTGRVTGPHLHFGVKVGGRWADPESLLRLTFASAAD